jgi:REP element-mobilizing transposase RayT
MLHSKLPHIDLKEHYQFITFRTNASLSSYLEKLYASDLENRKKQMLIDDHLDHSSNGAYLYGERIEIVKKVIFAKEGEWYEVVALSVMPNHIHLLLKQKVSVGKIMKYIKAKSAIDLNKVLGLSGQFWANDYYDRVIRNEMHFDTVYRYVMHNPQKAGLQDAEKRVYGVYE